MSRHSTQQNRRFRRGSRIPRWAPEDPRPRYHRVKVRSVVEEKEYFPVFEDACTSTGMIFWGEYLLRMDRIDEYSRSEASPPIQPEPSAGGLYVLVFRREPLDTRSLVPRFDVRDRDVLEIFVTFPISL